MATWTPDPSFYPSPRMAMKAAPETLAYVAAFDPDRKTPDAIAVVDVDPKSKSYSTVIGSTAMPNAGDELHHFGWNACSSCLCPNAPHAHAERRYLVVPGLRSSRIHILDTKPDPKKPKIVKVIEPETVAERAGYTRPHTVHCGPEGIYVAALGNREGKGPGGIFLMDHETFDVRGQWEMDRGPQHFAYDAWWHLGHDTLITSEWGTPDLFENGLIPEVLLGAKYGRRLHFWDLHKRKHLQTIDLGGSRPATARRIPTVILERRKPVIGVSASLEFWPWLAVAGLGAFHGLNPSMGWLFAVALGLHRQDRRIVWLALVPIALGHAVSVAAVALVFLWVGWFVDGWAFRVGAALILIGWALYHWRFSHRHRVRFGMQVGVAGLFVWSFLTAAAHGTGLMLWPALMPLCLPSGAGAVPASGLAAGLAGVGVHTLAMLSVTAAIAATVYEWVGLEVLRRTWLNIDALWVTALVATGMLMLLNTF